MVLVYMGWRRGWRRGWWSSWSKCPLVEIPAAHVDPAGEEEPAAGEEEAPAEHEAEEQEEEEVEVEEEAVDGDKEPMTKATARKAVSKLRAASRCTLHYVCTVLAKCVAKKRFKIYVNMTKYLEKDFWCDRQVIADSAKLFESNVALTNGKYFGTLRRLWLHCTSVEYADLVGFGREHRNGEGLERELELAHTAGTFMINCVCELALSNLWYVSQLPMRFLGLLGDEASLANTLSFLKASWRALGSIEEAAVASKDMQNVLLQVRWPYEQWSREIMVFLAETEFSRVPEGARQQITDFKDAWHSTLHVEQEWNNARDAQRLCKSGKFGGVALWHKVQESGTLRAWDRAPEDPTIESKVASKSQLPAWMFATPKKLSETELTVPEERTITGSKLFHPHMNSENVRRSSLIWLACVQLEGSPRALMSAWPSLLQEKGTVTRRSGRDFLQLVLAVTQYGFYSMRLGGDEHRRGRGAEASVCM